MKKRHYIITAVVAYFILLIASIPAKPITDLINNNAPVFIQGVSGTLWNGKAYAISIDNSYDLKDTEWSISIWQVLTARFAINVITHYADQDVTAELGSTFTGRYFVNNLQAKISAGKVTELAALPLAKLSGLFTIDIKHAEWKQGELPMALGKISWNDASVTVAETVALGNISILLDESAQQLLKADIQNQGGEIKIDGIAELVPEANYSVKIKLLPGSSSNANLKQSLGLFAKPLKNGEYLLDYSGALNEIGI